MNVRLVTAVSDSAWEGSLVAALERADHGVVVTRRAVDAVELLSVAAAGLAEVALVSRELPHVDAATVVDLHRTKTAVVMAYADAPDQHLGEDAVVSVGASPQDVVRAVLVAVESVAAADAAPTWPDESEVLARRPDHEGPAAPQAGSSGVLRVGQAPGTGSQVIAVWGPTGAPGRTTVAITLADQLARLGQPTVLVDCDTYGGSVAQALGVLDEGSGLLEACRDAAEGRLDSASLAERTRALPSGLRLLTGFARADRWPEASGPIVDKVIEQCRAAFGITVVDCGFSLERDDAAWDTLAPQRNGATHAVLAAADAVVAVCGPGPVAMQRYVRSLSELRSEMGGTLHVVVNQVAGAKEAAEAGALLERFAGVTPTAYLPDDRPVVRRALAQGRSLAEVAPAAPLVGAVGELAASVTGGALVAPSGARSGWRLGRRRRAAKRAPVRV